MRPLAERFWSKVDKRGPDECWPWTRATHREGYGAWHWRDADGQHGTPAHRMAYTLAVGPIPQGMEIDHLCRVRACCNPAHLEPVTHHENMARAGAFRAAQHERGSHCGSKRCRRCSGPKQRQPERTAEMARLYAGGLTLKRIGERYGITAQRVGQLFAKAAS